MSKTTSVKSQRQRFKEVARESDADMIKEEFGRVIGGLAKPSSSKQRLGNGKASSKKTPYDR